MSKRVSSNTNPERDAFTSDHDRHYNYTTERQSRVTWRVTVSEMALKYAYQTEERTVYIQQLQTRQF
jgi:mRNA-degrading endonuclease RelE of RelBE toxin-antitoxin system